MNLVLVGTAYPLRGGIAHYVGLLARHLAARHAVTVVTFSRQYPRFLFPGKSQEEIGDPGIPLDTRRWIDSINPFSWIRAGLRIRRLDPDAVVFKYWMPFFAPAYGTIAALARWRRRTRTVFIDDNVVPHERRPGDRLLTRFAFRFVDAHVVQSRAVERDLLALRPGASYAYLPHPVYENFGTERDRAEARARLERRVPGLRLGPEERVLLFFGYVRPYKGLDVLLDAVPQILRAASVRVLVVGEFYGDEEKYRAQASRLGLDASVHFHADYVPNDDVADWFSSCDVLVLPYKDATQSGIVQIAYNFNRPVIATDVGGLGEVVIDGETGYLVPPRDPSAVAKAVVGFFAEDRFDAFRARVLEEKGKYRWEYLVEGLEALVRGGRVNGEQ